MRRWLILFLIAFLASSAATGAADLTLASWNVRIFSTGWRDDTELALIADRLEPYDLVAIQELRDEEVVDRRGTGRSPQRRHQYPMDWVTEREGA